MRNVMWKMTLKKNAKNRLRARILTLLVAFGAARGGPRASQERPKTAPRAEDDWGECALWRSWALLGAFLRFFAIFIDFGSIFDRFLLDFSSIWATKNFATSGSTSRWWGGVNLAGQPRRAKPLGSSPSWPRGSVARQARQGVGQFRY